MSRFYSGAVITILLLLTLLVGVQTYVAIQGPDLPKLPKKTVETPVADESKQLGIFVKSIDGENSKYFTPDPSGIVAATMPGPNGETLSVEYRSQQHELHITINSPGAFPPNGGTS